MRSIRSVCGVVVLGLVVASCSGADDTVSDDRPSEPAVTTTSEPEPVPVVTEPEPVVIPDGPLAEVCPSTIVIQTTGQPGVQVGPLYELLGPGAVVGAGIVSGPLVRPDGTVDDVSLEIRSGGPSIGFRDAVDVAADDDAVTLAHTSTSAMVGRFGETPTVAVAALTDRSRQAIVIDPTTYPDVSDVADLAAAGVEVRHFTDAPAFRYLDATGVLPAELLVAGFDGSPAAFVAAGGAVAQQGDLLVDPGLFAAIPQWARPVTALALSDAGWADHDDVLAVRADDLEEFSDCLARVVPIVQQAIVAYADDPAPTNVLMAQARADSDPLSRVSAELLDAGATEAVTIGVLGNGDDDTVGDIDIDRLSDFLPDLADALDVGAVPIDDLATDAFIDPSVGL